MTTGIAVNLRQSILALTLACAMCVIHACEKEEPEDLSRDIAQLQIIVNELEERIDGGEYPALEESLKRQLEERRTELETLRAQQAAESPGE